MVFPVAPSWICCQLGAREHYAIPRALHHAGQLAQLITDAWVPPRSPLGSLSTAQAKALQERFHPDLSAANVRAFTPGLIQFELIHQLRKTGSWERMMARNAWFQKRVIQRLEHTVPSRAPSPTVLFSYGYAARDLLQYAKQKGWFTVLGQIDPGHLEEKIVQAEQEKYPALAPDWQPTPPEYWQIWREECQLADRIIVNSHWSQHLLIQAGIEETKIQQVPLVYEPSENTQSFVRKYPDQFSRERPLRVLFLGLINLRKGIAAVLESISLLEEYPIEFWFIGPQQIEIPDFLRHHPQVHWVGKVSRSETQHYYQSADVFLFPTLSDGFGLTQLEAQAWKLPIIASQYCGMVVDHQVNGLVLSEVTGEAIAQQLQTLIASPKLLTEFSRSSGLSMSFSINHLAEKLRALIQA